MPEIDMKERPAGEAIPLDEGPQSKPFEVWVEKHPEIDIFFVSFARGAYGWAQGREMTESAFLEAIERGRGHKMYASLPPKGHHTKLIGDDGKEVVVHLKRKADGTTERILSGTGKHVLSTPEK